MGYSIEANEMQIERNNKSRRDGLVPEVPTSTLLPVGPSETESDNIHMVVAK